MELTTWLQVARVSPPQGPQESDQLASLVFLRIECLVVVVLMGLVGSQTESCQAVETPLGLPSAPLIGGFLGDWTIVNCGSPSGAPTHCDPYPQDAIIWWAIGNLSPDWVSCLAWWCEGLSALGSDTVGSERAVPLLTVPLLGRF